MQKNICISVCDKKGYTACCVNYKGRVIFQKTIRSKRDNHFENIADGLRFAVRFTKNYVENNMSFNGDVVVDISNKAVLGWFLRAYANEKYAQCFNPLIEEIQELPIKVNYAYTPTVIAETFAEEKYLEKGEVKLSRISDI